MKLKQENNPLQLPIKIILNSIYGKTEQRIGNKIGNLFSPIIASTITGMTRAMLYEFVVQHGIENDVVSFATDRISSKEHNITLNSIFMYKIIQLSTTKASDKGKNHGIKQISYSMIDTLPCLTIGGI